MHTTHPWTRRYLAIVTAALVAAISPPPGNAQEPPKWADRKNATPGVQLTLQEKMRERTPRGTDVTYLVIASGLPDDKIYQVWFANDGISDFEQASLPANFKFTTAGMEWTARSFVKGEPMRMIITSTDRTVQAFAETYPFPIEARDGSCRLWVEIISHQGTAFAIHGEGFGADEDLTMTSQSGGEAIKKAGKALSDGTLPLNVVAPAVVGKQSGTATFSVAGKSCAPSVSYVWGPPALQSP